MKRQFLMIHGFFALIAVAFWYYHISGLGLLWNIFLALVAYHFSYLARTMTTKWLQVIFGFGWLFFYPNTFYMLTDLVHMHFAKDMLINQTSFSYYLVYMSSILLALIAGVLSVRYMLATLRIELFWLRCVMIGILSFVASLAIHVGRFARLNSWNVVTHPDIVMREILNVLSYSKMHFVLGFTFMQLMCLCLLTAKEER